MDQHTAVVEALRSLRLEAIHYKNTGVGKQFLEASIERAEKVLLSQPDSVADIEKLLGKRI